MQTVNLKVINDERLGEQNVSVNYNRAYTIKFCTRKGTLPAKPNVTMDIIFVNRLLSPITMYLRPHQLVNVVKAAQLQTLVWEFCLALRNV